MSIIVGRDRAHVRELLREFPDQEVISASAFFDKVRLLPFLYNLNLRRDDKAPLAFAQQILLSSREFSLQLAKNFVTLYSSFFHGTITPSMAYEKNSQESFAKVIEITAQIEQLMNEHQLLNSTSALFKAWRLMEEEKVLPPALAKTPRVSLRHLIDLTALEIEVIKSLSNSGIHIEVLFPLDFAKRSINVAVDHAARQFETAIDLPNLELSFDSLAEEGPLKPLIENLFVDNKVISISDEHCNINSYASFDVECNKICSNIAHLKSISPFASIAVAFRSFDEHASLFKRALLAHGLLVRDRKGEPLINSAAVALLKTIFNSCRYDLPRRELMGLINNPLFILDKEIHEINLGALLDCLGIDDNFSYSRCRYESAFSRFEKSLGENQPELVQLNTLRVFINKIKLVLSTLSTKKSWKAFLEEVKALVENYFSPENASVEALLLALKTLLPSAHFAGETKIDLRDFEGLLLLELSSITIAPIDYSDQNAVELLLLPELLGRTFDHIFIPGIAFGRLPKSMAADPLLSDQERLLLNKNLNRHVLRVILDDPFEPLSVPPRQALEPFWFASSLSAAKKSVHLSYASQDYKGVEEAPSEFFIWLMDHVRIINTNILASSSFVSHDYKRFLSGQKDTQNGVKNSLKQVLNERTAAFLNNIPSGHAFLFDSSSLKNSFEGRIEKKPSRALTPTFIEAFAQCTYAGFLNRIIGLKNNDIHMGDLDARIIGHIAHKTLEQFFGTSLSSETRIKERLKAVLKETSDDYLNKNFVPDLDIFYCYVEWLFDSLLLLTERLLEEGFKSPLAREKSFGPEENKKAVLVKSSGEPYLLGGVIDRIDAFEHGLVIMDYKLSRSERLREQGSSRALLVSNFQIPIYVRLAKQAWPNFSEPNISFTYASIRDGTLVPVWSLTKHEDLAQRIFNDEHEKSLAQAIDRIFAPVKKGAVIAQVGEHCLTCDFAFVCRKKERGCHDS